jgi:hypothetical protein
MSGQRVDFTSFVASIGAGAAAALQQVDELRRGGGADAGEGGNESLTAQQVQEQVQGALVAARQLIDTLVLLEEKTEGNLTDAEREALRNTLSHLRVAYVKSATPGN